MKFGKGGGPSLHSFAVALAVFSALVGPALVSPALAGPAGRVLQSQARLFSLAVSGAPSPQPLNHMHSFTILLKDAAGRPLDGATISVAGQRRYAPNELPTVPRASPEGKGVYRIDGLRFHMAGEWRLAFDIEVGQVRDRASLDVMVR